MEVQKRVKPVTSFSDPKIITTLNDSQLAEVISITSYALGGKSLDDFAIDFPVWKRVGLDEPRGIFRFAAVENNRVLGGAFLRTAKIWINDGHTLPVAIVGGVAVDPSVRGRGIGGKILTAVMAQVDSLRIPLTVLWGIPSRLYENFGFSPLPGQIEVLLDESPKKDSLPKENVTGLTGEWISGYHFDIFQKRLSVREGLALQNADISWYSLHSRVQWWRYLEKGQMKAYFGTGRGIDLAGIVHEWWVEKRECLPAYLVELQKKTQAHALISSARHKSFFSEKGYPVNEQTLCLARVSGPLAVKDLSSIWFWGLDSA